MRKERWWRVRIFGLGARRNAGVASGARARSVSRRSRGHLCVYQGIHSAHKHLRAVQVPES